jgi:hypothetical protein
MPTSETVDPDRLTEQVIELRNYLASILEGDVLIEVDTMLRAIAPGLESDPAGTGDRLRAGQNSLDRKGVSRRLASDGSPRYAFDSSNSYTKLLDRERALAECQPRCAVKLRANDAEGIFRKHCISLDVTARLV